MAIEALDGNLFGHEQPCFGCGPTHPYGFHLKFERHEDGVLTRFTPNDRYQGPPGIMHGGLVMTLADEAAAWAILAKLGKFGFTASCDSKLKAPVRVGTELECFARVTKDGSRVVRTEVTISQKKQLCFTAELVFVLLDKSGAEKLLQGPIPEEWNRFCRS